MSFTDPIFFLFLTTFLGLWPWLRQADARRWAGITLFSFIFYGWWDWRFTLLLAGTGALDFSAALLMPRLPRYRRFLLWVSVGSNLGVLFFFKYTAFLHARVPSLLAGPPRILGGRHSQSSCPSASASTRFSR